MDTLIIFQTSSDQDFSHIFKNLKCTSKLPGRDDKILRIPEYRIQLDLNYEIVKIMGPFNGSLLRTRKINMDVD